MLAAEKLLRRGVEEGVFPYAEWALFDRNGIESSGATAGEGGRWFDLASLTKTFTATALLGLVKAGGLRLSESAGELLAPASPKLRGYLDKMSLFSLMTHTSGLPAWYPFYADGRPFFEALEELLENRKTFDYTDTTAEPLRAVEGITTHALTIAPILTNGDITGAVAFMATDDTELCTDKQSMLAKAAALFLGKQIEE